LFELPEKISHQEGDSHSSPLDLRKLSVAGWYLCLIGFSILFLWPFLTSGTERTKWEFRKLPLGLAVFQEGWDNLLIWPSIGFPAFIEPTSTFDVWVLCRWKPSTWKVYVDNIQLMILETSENAGIWKINVQLPENMIEGLHNLSVEVDNVKIGEKKGRNSVVILSMPSVPRIAAISDTHLDEENWRITTFEITPSPLVSSQKLQRLPGPLKSLLESLSEKGIGRIKNGVRVGKPEHAQKLFQVLCYIRENIRPHLVLITGDLVEYSSWSSWEKLYEVLTSSRLPVCLVAGNHDYYSRLFGIQGRKWLAPFYRDFNSFDVYGFQLGKYYLLGINSGKDWKPLDSTRGSGLEKEQICWLHRLENQKNLILFLHHPSHENQPGLYRGWWEVLPPESVTLVICGHTHPWVPVESMVHGVKQIEVPSLRDSEDFARAVFVLPAENN
jgi:predicted phosphodiesterase